MALGVANLVADVLSTIDVIDDKHPHTGRPDGSDNPSKISIKSFVECCCLVLRECEKIFRGLRSSRR